MLTLISLFTAILYVCIGLRILTFTSTHHKIKPFYSILAVVFVGFFLSNSVDILVNGQLVTTSEAILTLIFAAIIFIAKGNVAELFRMAIK